jgi:uncharacterized protein (DUF1778 family)
MIRMEGLACDQVLQLSATAEQRQLIDQAAAAEGISRTEFILRSCQERAWMCCWIARSSR